jgi:hypothetical protein
MSTDPIKDLPDLGKVETAAVIVLSLLVVYVVYQAYKTGQAVATMFGTEVTNIKNAVGDAIAGATTYVSDTVSGTVESLKTNAATAFDSAGKVVSDVAQAPQANMTQQAGQVGAAPAPDVAPDPNLMMELAP